METTILVLGTLSFISIAVYGTYKYICMGYAYYALNLVEREHSKAYLDSINSVF